MNPCPNRQYTTAHYDDVRNDTKLPTKLVATITFYAANAILSEKTLNYLKLCLTPRMMLHSILRHHLLFDFEINNVPCQNNFKLAIRS